MTQQVVFQGTIPNDGTGDNTLIRTQKYASNFTELYTPLGITISEIAAGVTPVNIGFPPGNVLRYGTNTTPGTTDMGGAISNALLSNNAVTMPAGLYFTSTTITIPSGSGLFGAGIINPSSNTPTAFGTVIQGALSLAIVVQLGSGSGTGATLKGVGITRAAGVPPANSIGLKVFCGFGPIYEDVFSWSHQVCIYHKGTGSASLGFWATRANTGAAYDAHVVIDTVPENRFEQCRFGSNGVLDQTCSAYVRITGGNGAAPAAGPNTVVFNNCQFNQGNGVHPANWLQFVNLNAPGVPTIDARVWLFSDCHIEGVDTALIKADSTWAAADRLGITNCNFNNSTKPFFDLPATGFAINGWRFTGNWIACSTFAPNVEIVNSLAVVGNDFETGAVTYNSGSTGGWVMTSIGNTYSAGASLTLSGTKWQSAIFADAIISSGTFTNTGTPNSAISLIIPGKSLVAWTPTLTFGGATAGTYTTQSASMSVMGNSVTLLWRIKLNVKSGNVGAAQVEGAPIAFNSGLFQSGATGTAVGLNNMAGLTMPIITQGPIGASNAIKLLSQGAAAVANLTDVNFANGSEISGGITYFL